MVYWLWMYFVDVAAVVAVLLLVWCVVGCVVFVAVVVFCWCLTLGSRSEEGLLRAMFLWGTPWWTFKRFERPPDLFGLILREYSRISNRERGSMNCLSL